MTDTMGIFCSKKIAWLYAQIKKTPATMMITGVYLFKVNELLIQSLSYVNGASYGATYHGVVTDAEVAIIYRSTNESKVFLRLPL